MASADGSIVIQVELDSQRAVREASGLETQFSKIGGLLGKIGRILGSVFAVRQLVRFGKEAIELGSDLAVVQNVVDVTFGSLNSEVNAFAKNAVTQFGLSELSAKQFTSTMGAMLKSMGFGERAAADMGMSIAGLAGDLASFYNLDPEQAFYKIRSGISGETEPLKQLSINLSVANLEQYALTQGINKSYDAMTQQEQALLRYNYLLSVTSDAQGDFARTSDSWANQTRILSEQFNSLKATIGQGLISAFTPVIQVINTVIAGLQTVANAFQQVMALLFGGSATGGAKNAVSGVADEYTQAAGGAADLAKNTKAAGKAAEEAKKQLMAFDELNVLQDTSSSPGGGGGAAGASGGGGLAIEPLTFGSEPIEDTVSPQIQAIVDKILYLIEPLRNIDFEPLKASLANLGGAFGNLGATVGDALEWAWFNVLVPLATWAIEDLAPATVDLLTSALSLLNDVLEALQPLGQWLWVNFLQPIAEWTGGVIVDVLTNVSDCLKKIGDWIKDHQEAVENIAIVVGSFAAAWELVNTAILVWNAISGLATVLTTGFGAAVAFLTSPITLVTLAIGALIAIVVLLVRNWDKVKEAAVKVWDKIKETWHAAGDWFYEYVTGPIVDKFWDMVGSVKEVWDNIVGAVRDAVNTILGWFGKVSGGSASFSVSAGAAPSAVRAMPVPNVPMEAKVPYLAKGAVIPPRSPFLAMLGDQSSGKNIEAPLSTIQDAVAKVTAAQDQISLLREQNQLLQELIETVSGIKIGDETIGKAALRYSRRYNRAMGV